MICPQCNQPAKTLLTVRYSAGRREQCWRACLEAIVSSNPGLSPPNLERMRVVSQWPVGPAALLPDLPAGAAGLTGG